MKKRSLLLAACSALTLLVSSCSSSGPVATFNSNQASASTIEYKSKQALRQLYAQNSQAAYLGSYAKGVLVFPNILKAGLGVGGQGGNGTLFLSDGTVRHYQSAAASYGLQAGIQKFGYAIFLMDDYAVTQLDNSGGWEVGSAPSLVVVDQGMSSSLSTTSIKKGTYVYFFNQRGLMAGLGMQGTKITRIYPKP